MAASRGSRVLTPDKRLALEAELRRVKAWCVGALPGLPIASAEYKAASALLDGVHAVLIAIFVDAKAAPSALGAVGRS